MEAVQTELLHTVAREYGIQTHYFDTEGEQIDVSAATYRAILAALGAGDDALSNLEQARLNARRRHWTRALEPVLVAWDGELGAVELRCSDWQAHGWTACRLRFERGGEREFGYQLEHEGVLAEETVDGVHYIARRLWIGGDMPRGYHTLEVTVANGETHKALVISAPREAWGPADEDRAKSWGVFTPLYAIPSARNWGVGDLTDMEGLITWTAGQGGTCVATLPLGPTFLNHPFEPSPYMPASRLGWNEVFIDVEAVPELERCQPALALTLDENFQAELERLRQTRHVDYAGVYSLKRQVLQHCARHFFRHKSKRHGAYQTFLEANPLIEEYAAFRALHEQRGASWHSWPEGQREGCLPEELFTEKALAEARQYHLYVQWIADEQQERVSRSARGQGATFYLDMPLGVHPDGFDAWRWQRCFADRVSAGAPPDGFFAKGQDWGFRPLHPEQLREERYGCVIAGVRQMMRNAGIVRIDHVMGLHRLYWVPYGMAATEGAYVEYNHEELFAILCLESHRAETQIVGEDLGTVAPLIRDGMREHGFQRMYVAQFDCSSDPGIALGTPIEIMAASLNTHDTPPFAAFWAGLDIDDRISMGLIDEVAAQGEHTGREMVRHALRAFLLQRDLLAPEDPDSAVAGACLEYLAASPAAVVLINLEDLWGELTAQNTPGTSSAQRPNWRQKMQRGLEDFTHDPAILALLGRIDSLRREASEDFASPHLSAPNPRRTP